MYIDLEVYVCNKKIRNNFKKYGQVWSIRVMIFICGKLILNMGMLDQAFTNKYWTVDIDNLDIDSNRK